MTEPTENLLFIETKGICMQPVVRGGEKLIIRSLPISELKLGDLILYKADSQLVCHRLVKKSKTGNGYRIYSRGDHYFGPVELVNEQMFLGKVIGIVRNNRIIHFEGAGQTLTNRISLAVLPLVNSIIKLCYRALTKIR